MRKAYSRRRSALALRHVGPLAGGLLALAAVALLLRVLAPGALVAAASPLWRLGAFMGGESRGLAALFHDRAALVAERDAALARVAELSGQNAALAAKADDLARLLGGRTERADAVLAGVLARPPVAPYDTLVIDQGTAAGVVAGAAVYGPGGVPAGVVASATQFSARVALYSSPAQVTAGWVGASRVPVDLVGRGAGSFYAEVPREASTTAGDPVYAAGPGALPIGSVARVDSDPSSPKAVLRIAPAVDPFTLTWVTVARP
jgi:cell shape-determining protein MreC